MLYYKPIMFCLNTIFSYMSDLVVLSFVIAENYFHSDCPCDIIVELVNQGLLLSKVLLT